MKGSQPGCSRIIAFCKNVITFEDYASKLKFKNRLVDHDRESDGRALLLSLGGFVVQCKNV